MKKLIAIVGQTSSGKSSLGISLAKFFDGEIVSADSRQVYRGLDWCSGKVTKEEMAEINWEEKSAVDIKNLVRGLNPIMGAFTYINDKKLKLWKVQVISFEEFKAKYNLNAENIELGKVILADTKQGLFLKAKDAVIEVIEIQAEGAKRMNAKDFLNGNKII